MTSRRATEWAASGPKYWRTISISKSMRPRYQPRYGGAGSLTCDIASCTTGDRHAHHRHRHRRHAQRIRRRALRGRFTFEIDCWDVHDALSREPDFVLLDVRSPGLFAQGHVPGAINLPHGKIIRSKMDQWPEATVFVIYCAGPHCNGNIEPDDAPGRTDTLGQLQGGLSCITTDVDNRVARCRI